MMSGQPILILKEGTERSRGKSAQSNNIAAAKAIADAVRSTLGPKGMDKMLVDSMGDVVITNDGVTILKEIDIEHPAAKMVVEVAKTQDDECGDGTTTAVVIAGELLKRAEDLVDQNVHPTVITNGFSMAAKRAVEIMMDMSTKVDINDEDTLKDIAKTAMTGKSVGSSMNLLADIAVKAVKAVANEEEDGYVVDINNIKVEKKHGGSAEDTTMIEGIILDKEKVHPRMPDTIKDAKIALIDSALEIKKTEVDAKIEITDPTQMQKFLDQEEESLKGMVEEVKKSGANVVFCQKGIDDLVQHFFSKENIFAIRRVSKSDMKKLAKATGGKVITNIKEIDPADLGFAGKVFSKKVGDDDMTFVTECKDAKAVSVLIRGGTEHVIEELDRALHDALKVTAVAIEDAAALPGGGAPEIEVALRLGDYAASVGGREQLAIEAFAHAMEVVPWTIAENAGFDAIDTLIELKSKHEGATPNRNIGIDITSGKSTDMSVSKIIEPFRVKKQAVNSATEVASMILRIDDVIASKQGGGGAPGGAGGMPGGPGGMPPGMGGMDY